MSESLITKYAIAHGLKELTKKKSFEKITIVDITKACGLNRQTFYYHFQDKYELVDWIYYNEAISLIINDLTLENWNEKVLQMLTKMKNEYYFYENTLKEGQENGFRDYLFHIASELFCDIVGKIAENEDMTEEQIHFISEFYAFGIVGIIISWAQHGMKETPEYLANQLKMVSEGTKKYAVARYLQNTPT